MMRRKADRDRVQRPAKQRIWAGCHARFCPWSFSAKARAAPPYPLGTEAGAEPGNGMGGPWWGRATLCAVSFASLIGTAVFQKVPASTASCLVFSKKKNGKLPVLGPFGFGSVAAVRSPRWDVAGPAKFGPSS